MAGSRTEVNVAGIGWNCACSSLTLRLGIWELSKISDLQLLLNKRFLKLRTNILGEGGAEKLLCCL